MSLEVISKNRQSHSLKTERQEYRDKLFNPLENEAVSPKKYGSKCKKNLREFKKQASKINFCPLGSRENYPGNYDNYVHGTLSPYNFLFWQFLSFKEFFKFSFTKRKLHINLLPSSFARHNSHSKVFF